MNEDDEDVIAVLTGEIVIRAGLNAEGKKVVYASFSDGDSSYLIDVVEGLGLLKFAEFDLLRRWETCDDPDCPEHGED